MTASIWAPGSTNVPSVDPASQLLSESFVATEGQTDFVITQFTYSINSGALTVYVNRAKLGHEYVEELTTTSFRIPACDVDDVVEVVGNVAIDDPSLYADAAAASAAEALGYRNTTLEYKNEAQASAVAADTSEANALASANAAATSESNALTYKNAAETAKTAAELAETNAESAATIAVSAKNTAVAAASDPNVVAVGQDLLEPVSEIETVASNIGNVNVVGANITNVNATGGNIANVNTVATNIANVNTVGSNITPVNTVATNVAAVNTCSTNIAAIIDAPNQASAAAASAAAAAASYDNFDDRYLGSKATPPTVDNDGNPLVVGALYYNNGTVVPADKGMYVWEGTSWIPASAASEAILTEFKYVATAGQTSFSGNDANGLPLVYTVGSVLVAQNGAWISNGTDFTATTGNSIVLSVGATVGDEIKIYAFATFDVANTYTQAQVNALLAGKIGTGAGTVQQSNLASGVAGNGPAFSAYVGTNQTISAATFTKISFDTAPSWGTATNSWDAANKRFTASVSGYYMFNGCVYSTGANGWTNQTLVIARINNSDEIRLQDAASNSYNLQVNGLVYLSAGQYLDFYIYASGGGTIAASLSLSWLRGTLVRAA